MLGELAGALLRIFIWGVLGCVAGLVVSAFVAQLTPDVSVRVGGILGGVAGFLLSG